jgi:O-antigen/teichoic acid export membrane protein
MKRETLFLKVVVFLIGIPILALCIFALPWIANEAAEHYPELAYLKYPVLIGVYVTAIAYFVALYQALRLLSYIDNNKAFSELSVKALKNIKFCAITISILYAAGMPLIFHMAQEDDAPGLGVLGLVITCAPIVIAVFAAVLQKLLKNAIDIKSENDLTV